jgi:outer membrane protein OmpA-like peptidoglycan-associated protein
MARDLTQHFLAALVVSQILLSSLVAQAFEPNVVMLDDDASLCAIFQALSPQVAPQCQGRSRSIVLQRPPTPTPVKYDATSASAKPGRVYAFATRIQFAWNSAQLAPEAYPILDNLAQVLQDGLMTDKTIRIEGHTDSAGSGAYNLRLSSHRALAVQRYLHAAHGVPLQRIPGKVRTL